MASVTTPIWKLAGGRVFRPAPFGIMGILNVTPDSFFDGGAYLQYPKALDRAAQLIADGAHILDLGAESSRPGALPLASDEEWLRLLPVMQGIQSAFPEALISVDTCHAHTAECALKAGAHIINDISACSYDALLLEKVLEYKPGYVLMHAQGRPYDMQNNPQYADVCDTVRAFFEEKLQVLTARGLPEEHIVLDPGIGFGKSVEHNLALLSRAHEFQDLGRPVLMGLSMKSVFASFSDGAPADRAVATQVATALLAQRGIVLHRVHDAIATARSLRLTLAMNSYG